MDWINKNPEHAVLIGTLALITVVGLGLGLTHSVEPPQSTFAGAEAKAENVDVSGYAGLEEKLTAKRYWNEPSSNSFNAYHALFASRQMEWLKVDRQLVIYDSSQSDWLGIPRDWKKKFRLSLSDRDIGLKDADADSFTNQEEYLSGTDPRNPASKPPYHVKLRLVDYSEAPLEMQFKDHSDFDGSGQLSFQVNMPGPREALKEKRSNRAKIGEGFGPWKVTAFQEKTDTVKNEALGLTETKDVSVLTIQHAKSGDEFKLVFEQKTKVPIIKASLLYELDGTTTVIEKGGEFTFKPADGPETVFMVAELGMRQIDGRSEPFAKLVPKVGTPIIVSPPPTHSRTAAAAAR